MGYIIVFLGAGVGGALRHGVNLLAARFLGLDFPYGTLAVNVIGSFVMAVIIAVFAESAELPQDLRLFLTTGILGGFTTFSTFSLDTIVLFERGEVGMACLYVGLSLGLSLGALFGGLLLARSFLAPVG
ncbi:putative fluoride ion transporter CrcB [Youhaiella tibetensis]|uniref:Fluoride-specific ion channel FluC n=1 Tax=Paradevosia tibetensis TaxID=1447062 RepID=A0A5B9DJ42_9HYPH|nr:fluoride efflux transporter CrcB [Youhaiella tibetensis]QEE18852.1 fluoride efflux transporter CrcB [Youhaiella tibetensis]GGF38562.1 putative fluoride ion transporter CrcB [Youhaiella tibetensis]